MKVLLVIISFFLVQASFAANSSKTEPISKEAQIEKMKDISKKIRRNYWTRGHDEVSSSFALVTKELLDTNIKENKSYETPLNQDKIYDLYKCYNGTTCELYLIDISAEYWGGSGYSNHYILLYPNSGKYYEIQHTVYAE